MGSQLRVSNGGGQQKPLGAGGVHHLRLLYNECARVVFRGGMVEFDGRQSMPEGIAEERRIPAVVSEGRRRPAGARGAV